MNNNSKNWSDKADKDLFFTILSVKNIGVISGSEWTTIGNHMRTLGYGFTNEGCRQHFQGLRRAQAKAEANGPVAESTRKVDPTLNPITRRPGPGRGRPRKSATGQPGEPGHGDLNSGVATPDESQMSVEPTGVPGAPGVPPAIPTAPMDASVVQPDGLGDADANGEEAEEHVAKRPRLEENQDPALDDEAVLSALAAHSNPNPVDHYNSEFYGEA